jgi:hypothetical protein
VNVWLLRDPVTDDNNLSADNLDPSCNVVLFPSLSVSWVQRLFPRVGCYHGTPLFETRFHDVDAFIRHQPQ